MKRHSIAQIGLPESEFATGLQVDLALDGAVGFRAEPGHQKFRRSPCLEHQLRRHIHYALQHQVQLILHFSSVSGKHDIKYTVWKFYDPRIQACFINCPRFSGLNDCQQFRVHVSREQQGTFESGSTHILLLLRKPRILARYPNSARGKRNPTDRRHRLRKSKLWEKPGPHPSAAHR